MSSVGDSQHEPLGHHTGPQDDGDESWLSVAEIDNQSAQKLSQEIMELDSIVSDTDAETFSDAPSRQAISASDRVARFQKNQKKKDGEVCFDDPFWIEDFWTITETMEETVSEDGTRTLQEPVNIVSGCSGLLAEAWVCKVRWASRVLSYHI